MLLGMDAKSMHAASSTCLPVGRRDKHACLLGLCAESPQCRLALGLVGCLGTFGWLLPDAADS